MGKDGRNHAKEWYNVYTVMRMEKKVAKFNRGR
jgi:hypothetical protein